MHWAYVHFFFKIQDSKQQRGDRTGNMIVGSTTFRDPLC